MKDLYPEYRKNFQNTMVRAETIQLKTGQKI